MIIIKYIEKSVKDLIKKYIRKREENGTTDFNIYASYNDNAVWNLPVGIFSGSEAG